MLINSENFDTITELNGENYSINKKCSCSKCIVESTWVKLECNGKVFITSAIIL